MLNPRTYEEAYSPRWERITKLHLAAFIILTAAGATGSCLLILGRQTFVGFVVFACAMTFACLVGYTLSLLYPAYGNRSRLVRRRRRHCT